MKNFAKIYKVLVFALTVKHKEKKCQTHLNFFLMTQLFLMTVMLCYSYLCLLKVCVAYFRLNVPRLLCC